MKTIAAATQAHLDTDDTDLVACLRIEKTDGTIIGVTDHPEDFVINSVTYLSTAGGIPSATSSNINLQAGSIDIGLLLGAAGIPRADIVSGVYDYADCYVFETRPSAPIEDDIPWFRGEFGEAELEDNRVTVKFVGLTHYLSQNVGRTYRASCDADLGNTPDASGRTRCGVDLTPPTWAATTAYTLNEGVDAKIGSYVQPTTENGAFFRCTTAGTSGGSEPTWDTTAGNTTADGTVVWTAFVGWTLTGSVTSVTDEFTFEDTARIEAEIYWQGGKITWTSGSNNGFSMEVKEFKLVTAVPTFVLSESMFYPIAVSDTYTVTVGCLKRKIEDCKDKFLNVRNFQGFDKVPTDFQANERGEK